MRGYGRMLRWCAVLALLGACGGTEEPSDAPDVPDARAGPDPVRTDREPGVVDPAFAGGTLLGLYASLPEGAVFTVCGSDRVLAVAPGGRADELERTFLLAADGGDAPALVALVGRVVEGGPPDAPDLRLAVDSVVRVEAGADCPGLPVAPPLEGTAWQLVGLPPSDAGLAGVGAWMRLDGNGRVEGFTGCRDLSARYDWRGTALSFTSIDATVGMCEAAEAHALFLDALQRTGSYRFRAGGLELLDEAGPVARFDTR